MEHRIGMDLHIHSAYSSDGEIPVAGIAERCAASGTAIFSLTDHNCVRGWTKPPGARRRLGWDLCPASRSIAISKASTCTCWDTASTGVPGFRVVGAGRCGEGHGGIRGDGAPAPQAGVAVDGAAVLAAAGGKLPTLELVAEVMLSDAAYDTPLLAPYREGGARGDMPYINFYLDYGAQGRPAFVPVDFMDYRDAVA